MYRRNRNNATLVSWKRSSNQQLSNESGWNRQFGIFIVALSNRALDNASAPEVTNQRKSSYYRGRTILHRHRQDHTNYKGEVHMNRCSNRRNRNNATLVSWKRSSNQKLSNESGWNRQFGTFIVALSNRALDDGSALEVTNQRKCSYYRGRTILHRHRQDHTNYKGEVHMNRCSNRRNRNNATLVSWKRSSSPKSSQTKADGIDNLASSLLPCQIGSRSH